MKKNRLNITLLIPHYQNMFSTFYTLEIIKEVSQAAIQADVDLLIETTWKTSRDGGILFADMKGNEKWIKKARRENIPYIVLNYYNPDIKENCIGINNEKASFEAVNYLLKAGHSRIATITGKLDVEVGIERLEGFKKALKTSKIDWDKKYIVTGDWTEESGRAAIKILLSLATPPSAVFVAGDEMAMGAMRVTKEAGLKIPDDVSFVGFDNIPQAESPEICLTTVEQPFSDLAKLGIKYILELMEKKTKQPIKIRLENTKLIKRKSVKEIGLEVRGIEI